MGIMLLPTTTMLVPQFVVMKELTYQQILGFDSTRHWWGPSVFSMRQFIPAFSEMLEAARMDGANEFALFFRIVLPNASAGVGVIATPQLRATERSLVAAAPYLRS